MLECIIVEDQPPAQRILKKYIGDHPELVLKGVFSDTSGFQDFLEREHVDLIFLDIHLPKISGLDFLKSLPSHPPIILTTAFPNYALESYQYHVIDYLLKPFSAERFNQAVSKLSVFSDIVRHAEEGDKKTIMVKSGHERIHILQSEIICIQSDADYTELMCDGTKHLCGQPLRHWLETLSDTFCQVHKSYVVNLSHLKKVSQNKVYLSAGYVVPIGRAYKKDFMNRWQ